MEKEEHWKLLDSFTSDTPIEGKVEVKQYLTPAHVNLLNRIIAIDEAHGELIAVLTDSDLFTVDNKVLGKVATQLGDSLTLLAGYLTLSATPIHD